MNTKKQNNSKENTPVKAKKPAGFDSDVRTIKKIYENYGINTDDMSEDEFERLYYQYKHSGKSLNNDLKESEKFSSRFNEDDIIG